MRRLSILLAGLALALALPSVSFASSNNPTCQSYNAPQLCSVVNASTSRTTGNTSSSASTLPFTGIDVVLLAAGGAALLGAGLVVRRLSRVGD